MSCSGGAGFSSPCNNSLSGAVNSSFVGLVSTILASQCAFNNEDKHKEDYRFAAWNPPFDYIIVGCGTSGSVLANRLSADGTSKVLVLEAGGVPSVNTQIPGFVNSYEYNEVWRQDAEVGNACLGFSNAKCVHTSGKMMGGSSNINDMIYQRGSKDDFKSWPWDWDTVLKYYLKSEDCKVDSLIGPKHAKGGPLIISRPVIDETVRDMILLAANDLGKEVHADDSSTNGYFEALTTIWQGERSSSSKAFLTPIRARSNLFIARHTIVESIQIRNGRARDLIVQTAQVGRLILNARKEIIVTAGTINTPILLQQSGIGIKEDLENLGITQIANLRTGQNLQNHIFLQGIFINITDPQLEHELEDEIDAAYLYFRKHKGPLAGIGIGNLLGFINTKNNSLIPDVMIKHAFYQKNDLKLKKDLEHYGMDAASVASILRANKETMLLQLKPILLKPASVGQVKLLPGRDRPVILSNFLSRREDVEVFIGFGRYVQQFLRTDTIKMRKAELLDFDHPCKNEVFETDWECYAAYFSLATNDWSGTCKMGPQSEGGVVDERLKVHGIRNLRVADASVMPGPISGGISAATVMIGERCADFILEDNK